MACKALPLSSSSLYHARFPTKTLRLRRLLRSACFSKTSFFLYVNNRIDRNDRWYNPDRQIRFVDPKIVRRWIQSDSPPPYDSQERFTVVSYNILGDRNASKHSGLYSNVPSQFMNWDYWKRVICEELIGLSPDIICLQLSPSSREVDKYYDLSIIMEKEGYVGTYMRRTEEAIDGCAMFWKADVFKLLEGESIEFKEFGLCDNVAQLSVFEIHLLLLRAHALSEKWGNIPVVLAGDFNSTPQSAVYKFLSSSELNITLYDRRDLSGQRSCHPSQFSSSFKRQISKPFILMDSFFEFCWTDEEVKTATGDSSSSVIEHPLKLCSSYATEGEYLVPTRVLDTPSIDVIRKTGGLPNKKLGSDHLALGSEYAFTQCDREDEYGPNPKLHILKASSGVASTYNLPY